MSATSYPAPPPAGGSRRRSVASMVIGWILVVLGFLTALAGAAVMLIFINGPVVSSSSVTLSTSTPALVIDLGAIRNSSDARSLLGQVSLVVRDVGTGGEPVFIGIAPTSDVQQYLSGVAQDRVTDFELSRVDLTADRTDGSDLAGRPADQTFWLATLQTGSGPDMSWPIADGSFEAVVMNADGSAGVSAPVAVGISIANSTWLWIIVLAVGAVILVGGIVLVVVGSRRVPAS
jgi:hypothetical protein